MNEISLLEKQLEILNGGGDYALLTIVQSENCTRTSGRMVVDAKGTAYGTIGGGALEQMAIRDAVKIIAGGESCIRAYHTEGGAGAEHFCAGSMSVMVDVYRARPTLLMIGAGHVAGALMRVAALTGFSITLVDHRPDDVISDKIAMADRYFHVDDYEAGVAQMHIPSDAFVVLGTSTHVTDCAALYAVMCREPFHYVGMLGKRGKIESIFSRLLERGVPKERLEAVYTPIGLSIGGETPEEIAVSIMAEILAVKYNRADVGHLRRGAASFLP